MPKLAANLTMLYNEVDFLDRFAAAAAAGFKGVEFLFPYAYPKEQLAEQLAQHRLVQVLHNLPAGDWAAGERGIACHPERVGEFQDGVGKAIDYAKALGCPQVNCLAGIAPKGVDAGPRARDVRRQPQVRRAEARGGGHQAPDRADQHVRHSRLLSQPDAAGARHHRATSARTISTSSTTSITCSGWRASSRPRSRRTCRRSRTCSSPTIRAATSPGPARSTTASCSASSMRIGYDGWIGCEYKPKGNTVDGLAWRAAHSV